MPIRWYGEQVLTRVRQHEAQVLDRAARTLRDHIRQKLLAAAGPSRPGDYPGYRTGHLARNVQSETDPARLVARVGTNVLYGRYLEFGTRRMAARPWLSRALWDFAPEIARILSRAVPGGR